MFESSNPISTKTTLKILLVWLPLLLWYALVFFFPYSQAVFHKVDSIYYGAAHNWYQQQSVYGTYTPTDNGRFVYLPTSAALLSPLSLLSLKAFEIVFRILSVTFLSLGIYHFSRYVAECNQKRAFFVTLLVTVLLSQAAFFQGQLHIMTTGMMLLGYVAIVREKWWQSALWLTLAVALKPTSIVLYLLALALYPRLSWRLFISTAALFLLSFVMQSPHYVADQYHAFVLSFQTDMRYDGSNAKHWATLFGAIAFYTHQKIQGDLQFGIRIVAALFVFAVALLARIKFNAREAIYFIFALGMCYLMLFNSRTENMDYIMVAPAIGYSLFLAITNKKYWQAFGLGLAIFLLAINWEVSRVISPHDNVWLSPSVVFVYFIYLLREIHIRNI